jgi:hypothetical protein
VKRRTLGVLAGLALVATLPLVSWGADETFTICHAAGQEGTTQFVELTLPFPAVFGEAGHFFENGTPRAGHEQDILGPCPTTSTSTTQGDPEPTTTVFNTTTTEATTTTTLAPTTTILETTTTTELVLGDIEAVCVGDIPYLSYAVDFPGATAVDITFLNPGGEDLSYPGQPLSGQVLWPGASDVFPFDWPGWELVDGVWVEADDGFLWARETVTVVFTVNPTAEVQVDYPEATSACANPTNAPPGAAPPPGSPTLPFTGSHDAGTIALAATSLVAAGVLGLAVARRRHEQADVD